MECNSVENWLGMLEMEYTKGGAISVCLSAAEWCHEKHLYGAECFFKNCSENVKLGSVIHIPIFDHCHVSKTAALLKASCRGLRKVAVLRLSTLHGDINTMYYAIPAKESVAEYPPLGSLFSVMEFPNAEKKFALTMIVECEFSVDDYDSNIVLGPWTHSAETQSDQRH